jgi:hypothetical protein
MSDRPVAEVAEEYQQLSKLVRDNGCTMKAPFMTLSFMALLVIPDLKIGDKGLFDVRKFQPVSLFVYVETPYVLQNQPPRPLVETLHATSIFICV